MNPLKYAWITVNRQCNLRCKWCYAKSADFKTSSDMPLSLAKELIDLASQLNIQNISVTGGEPTCHKDIAQIIQYIRQKNLTPILITNGVLFSDKSFLDSLVSQGLSSVNLSIKGCSEEDYMKNTGVKAYASTLEAIRHISKSSVRLLVSIVLNSDNIGRYLNAIKDAVENGAEEFHFSFEHDFSMLDGNPKPYDIRSIHKLIKGFQESYPELSVITNGRFNLHQSLPLCLWDESFIQILKKNGQITTSCQLLERSGLVFDTDGSLIPCNLMHQVPIGKFGQDFSDKNSFLSFWNSQEVSNVYRKLCTYPGKKCHTCNENIHCGGGCLSNWFQFSYDELIY